MNQNPTNDTNCGQYTRSASMSHPAGNHIEHVGTWSNNQRPRDANEQSKFCWFNHLFLRKRARFVEMEFSPLTVLISPVRSSRGSGGGSYRRNELPTKPNNKRRPTPSTLQPKAAKKLGSATKQFNR